MPYTPPHERLRISPVAYSLRHVQNIYRQLGAVELAPHIMADQDRLAQHINGIFTAAQVSDAERAVRHSYASDNTYKTYRKGRPKGSVNKPKTISVTVEPLARIFENISEPEPESETTYTQTTPNAPAVESAPVPSATLEAMLADYAKHVDVSINVAMLRKEYNASDETLLGIMDKLSNRVEDIAKRTPIEVILTAPSLPTPLNLSVQHKHFQELLLMCNSALFDGGRPNIWVYGPAGTGKTTAAKMVAKAFGWSDRFYVLGVLESAFQVLGYNDAHGRYVSTLFRKCWEFGGIIALDEADSYMQGAALALNGALANGVAAFPDGMVPRHPECIIIAGANTTGLGATMEYTGRMKQDAAFLDRFVTLDWPIDETLEDHICPNKQWLTIVRLVRQKVIDRQIKGAMITPRATIYGESLLRAGLTIERVMKSTLQKGMSDQQWAMVAPSFDIVNQVRSA